MGSSHIHQPVEIPRAIVVWYSMPLSNPRTDIWGFCNADPSGDGHGLLALAGVS